MITIVELRAHLGVNESNFSDDQLDLVLETAFETLDVWLGTKKDKVPTNTYDICLLGVAQQLYYRMTKDSSSSGQYSEGDFVLSRPKDPMHYAYPMLRRHVGWF